MNDQAIMENLLLTTKGVCDLYMHGAVESSTQNVHHAFDVALGDCLNMQEDLYRQMTAKGWYQTQEAEPQQIAQVHQKFAMAN